MNVTSAPSTVRVHVARGQAEVFDRWGHLLRRTDTTETCSGQSGQTLGLLWSAPTMDFTISAQAGTDLQTTYPAATQWNISETFTMQAQLQSGSLQFSADAINAAFQCANDLGVMTFNSNRYLRRNSERFGRFTGRRGRHRAGWRRIHN